MRLMRKLLSAVVWAAVVASLASPTGAADLAALAGAGPRPGLFPPSLRQAPAPPAPPALAASEKTKFDRTAFVEIPVRPEKPEPIRDRMLVVKEKGFIGAVARDARAQSSTVGRRFPGRRSEGAWLESGSLRFRLTYFSDRVTAELELENKGAAELRGIQIGSRQETLGTSAKPGCPLGLAVGAGSLRVLAPGGKAVVRYFVRPLGSGPGRSGQEQTHLIITAEGATIVNELRAGVVP